MRWRGGKETTSGAGGRELEPSSAPILAFISLFTRSLSPGVLVSWRQPVHPGSKHGKPAGFPKKPAVEPQFVRFDCIPGFPVFYLKWTGEGSGSQFNLSGPVLITVVLII